MDKKTALQQLDVLKQWIRGTSIQYLSPSKNEWVDSLPFSGKYTFNSEHKLRIKPILLTKWLIIDKYNETYKSYKTESEADVALVYLKENDKFRIVQMQEVV